MRNLALYAALLCAVCAHAQKTEPKRILYFTKWASYYHEILPYSVERMEAWAKKDGGYRVDASDDCALITPENLAKYDALVFYTNRELPLSEPNRQAILDFVKYGKGFVAVHSGTGTFFEWTPYQEMINAIFDGHPWTQKVRVTVEQAGHPIMNGLPERFEVYDEIYQHTNWRRAVTHVLASLDVTSVDLNAKGVKRTDKDFGIAWAHRYGLGRVYVNVLGHTKEVWDDRNFERMMVQGIHWAIGDLPLELPETARTGTE